MKEIKYKSSWRCTVFGCKFSEGSGFNSQWCKRCGSYELLEEHSYAFLDEYSGDIMVVINKSDLTLKKELKLLQENKHKEELSRHYEDTRLLAKDFD